MLRKIAIFVFIILISIGFLPYRAFAGQAVVLSDAELDAVSAAGFDIDINAVLAYRSSVAAQSNIAAIYGLGASAVSLSNSNFAQVNNFGNSAVAVQSNIAAVVAKEGDIQSATINNTNTANLNNTGNASGQAHATSLNLDLSPQAVLTRINQVLANYSAVASQSNVAAVVSLNGNIKDTVINNANTANLTNLGNSAVAAQSNIAVLVAQGTIDNSSINNSNIADVVNTGLPAASPGGANLQNFTYSGVFGNLNINHILVNYSASANQSNIAVIVSLGGGDVTNSSVNNSNIANVQNF
jgi:hypothetical protein